MCRGQGSLKDQIFDSPMEGIVVGISLCQQVEVSFAGLEKNGWEAVDLELSDHGEFLLGAVGVCFCV